MEYFAATDIGNYRDKNEDFYFCNDNLFIVADGMGGHKAGEIASRTAVENFVKHFQSVPKNNTQNIREAMIKSINFSNNEIIKLSKEKENYYGMGTTFTGCYIEDNKAHIIHVGDSRLYLKNSRQLKLLTSDHTIVGELFRKGLITYEDAFNHPQKNYLTNALGSENELIPDYISLDLEKKDIILLCSDGLNSMLRDTFIFKIIKQFKNPEEITKKLIYWAKNRGGLDNITVISIKI
ncbi:MAG: Stp1/IreP family PP2C-type Ser/Thr phosphatase [Actinobacteria bacterium]|nr:Stp1/IreP family PP2C-type Ser/Thr phosphatase [Actinomycetota bacterium]MCL5069444.1 Stp1/IreP family PP2C-type Ser/Thr phosphatase [Actinomycetota bacterium]